MSPVHDYVIANGTGSAVRSDLNNALAAIVSNNSSSSEPSTKYAYQWWADTTTGQLKLRNSANNGWVTIFELDGTMLMEDGTVSAPGLAFASDLNTGFFRSAADTLAIATAGAQRVTVDSSGRLLVGTSTSNGSAGSKLEVAKQTTTTSDMGLASFQLVSSSSRWPQVFLEKSRGSAVGDKDLVSDGDSLGELAFRGSDGANYLTGASIIATVNGTPGTNDLPTDLTFRTTADGAASTTERLRITSDGKCGIGTSPNRKLQVEGASGGNGQILISTAGAFSGTDTADLSFRIYANPSNGNAHNPQAQIQAIGTGSYDAALAFKTATGGADNNSPIERMRLDSSGNLGLGTSSPNDDYGFGRIIDIRSNTGAAIYFRDIDDASNDKFAVGRDNASSYLTTASGDLIFSMSGSTRMRLESDGHWNVFTDTSAGIRTNRTAGTQDAFFVKSGATTIGTGTSVFAVKADGDCENTNNRYGQISDQKLKENIINASSQWDDIKAIQVRNFNFKEETNYGTHTQIGLIAQEVETVSPGLVDEANDIDDEGNDLGTTTKSVAYSLLYMKAVKALQEAMTRIETLETKVAALEAG